MPVEFGGRELWISGSGVGFEEGTVYAFRDLTEERALEEIKADFVATVSHELRTPLAAIYGSAQTLRRTDIELDPEIQVQLLGVIASESDRLGTIVNDLLVAGSLDADQLPVSVERCDPAVLAGSVIEAARTHLPEAIELQLKAAEAAAASRRRSRSSCTRCSSTSSTTRSSTRRRAARSQCRSRTATV